MLAVVTYNNLVERKMYMILTQGKVVGKSLMMVVVSLAAIAAYALLLNVMPLADLAKEFGIPTVAANLILSALDWGMTAATILSIVAGIATGGLSLIAAAGQATLKEFLKKELEKRGRKAFIAW